MRFAPRLTRRTCSLVAERLALQDAMYALTKACFEGRASAPAYLKAIRDLAREHFMAKALLAKIRAAPNKH